MPSHFFDTDVAAEFGLVEAVLINHFQFWIAHNRANKTNMRNGRTWTYNSVKALQELFPYMGAKQIRGALTRLETAGILLVDNYNQTPYDRTLWYAFADEERWLGLPVSRIAKKAGDICQKGEPIPDKFPHKSTPEGTTTPTPSDPPTVDTGVPARASEHEGVAWPWDTETFWEAWHGWREYKRVEFKFRYKGRQSEQAALNLLKRLSGDDEAVAHAILLQSKANGWSGLFHLKIDNHATHQGAAANGSNGTKGGISAARVDAIRNW